MDKIKIKIWDNNTFKPFHVRSRLDNRFALRFTNLKDRQNQEVCEGDLREINGKLYKIVDDGFRFRFERNLFQFGENKDILLDEDTAYISVLKGNIFENPELMEKSKKISLEEK